MVFEARNRPYTRKEPRWAWFRRFNPFVACPARAILASFLYSASARNALDLEDIFKVTKKSVCCANSLKNNIHRRNRPTRFSGWGSLSSL